MGLVIGITDNLVTLSHMSVTRALVALKAQGPEMKKLLEQLNFTAQASDREGEGIAFMILTGLYLGFLPDHYAERWVQSGQVRALCPAQMSYDMEYAAITRKGVRPNMVLDTFLQGLMPSPETS